MIKSRYTIMGRIFIFCLVVLMSLSITGDLNATHIVGGDLTYKYIGKNQYGVSQYQVRLTLRRDCFLGSPEAEFDNPASIAVFTSGGALASWLPGLFAGELRIPFMASDTLNEYIQSDCGFEGTQVCVHETIYQGVVALPDRPGGYILAYQRCCRNASLNNVLNPLETGSTYWVAINDDALRIQNSSPTFKQWPDVYICADKPLIFDHSAVDPDGDSLAYKLVTPNTGGTRVFPRPQPAFPPPYGLVQFAPPYNLNDLMGGVPLTIDAKTGLMTATPNLVGQFLVGVAVEEYRDGQLIGLVRRDFQFNVRICSQPPLAQFTTSETNCDGLTVEFYNNSLASSDFEWNFNYPDGGPDFISTEKNPVFTFPTSGIYKVRLRAVRGSDQCSDEVIQEVAVFENKIEPGFFYKLNGCDMDGDSLEILLTDSSEFNEPGFDLSDWTWKATQNGKEINLSGNPARVKVSNSGDVTIEMHVGAENGCESSLTKIIDIQQLIPNVDFSLKLKDCPTEEEATFILTDLSPGLNPFGILENSTWDVNGQTYTGSPIEITLNQKTPTINVALTSSFREACEVSIEKAFEIKNILPFTDATLEYPGCPDDDNVSIKLSYNDHLANGLQAVSWSWDAGIRSNLNHYTSSVVDIVIPKDSVLHYTLTTVYENGCLNTLSLDTLPGPFARIKFVGDTILLCPGDIKRILTNGNPDWTYTWTPTDGLDLTDPANPTVSSDINRTYHVTVTDGLCTSTGSVDVIALAGGVDVDILGDTITCDGSITLTATGGVGLGVYSWATDSTNTNIVAMGEIVTIPFTGREKTFYVSFIGAACSTHPTGIKVRNEVPVIDNFSPIGFCREDTSKIIILNEIDDHNNTYTWDSDPHIISGGNTTEPLIGIGPDENDGFTLYFTVINQYGCTLRDSVEFNIQDNPVVDFSYNLMDCGQQMLCFELSGTFNGIPTWDFGDPTSQDDFSLENNPCYRYPEGGTYTVKLSNTSAICPFKDVVKEIVVNPELALIGTEDREICLGDSHTLSVAANIENINFEWQDDQGTVLDTDHTFNGVISDDTRFIIIGTDAFGCTVTDTIDVSVFKFDFSIDTQDSLCVDEPSRIHLNLDTSENYIIEWLPAGIVQSGQNTPDPVIIPSKNEKIFVVLVNKTNGCVDTSSVDVIVTQPFDFDVQYPELICYQAPTILNLIIDNPSDYTYEWTPQEFFFDGTNTPNPVLVVQGDNVVKVIVTKISSGCKEELEVPVSVTDPLEINVQIVPDTIIYEGESAELNIENIISGATYEWSTGETGTSITVSPIDETSYIVTVTDENGCTATDVVKVAVRKAKCDESDVYLPNAFSPNGDGANDIFIARSHFIDEYELVIYNRWGQEVFRTTDKNQGWDGTFNGRALPPDSYAYYLKVICINAVDYRKRGNVTLIR
ncbi:MAG: gliding motility-associated C-terminal domain-containing protein [Chitinophagales bacterium]|nr:gliding motility-associated C-terminal domain-containing protein [Chitinophagales bacterium]